MILAMHRQFCREGDILTVTGELYGGNIQNQITYQDDIDFAAFDIFVNQEKIDHGTFESWTLATGIPTVTVVATLSSFEDALQFDPVRQSSHSPIGDLAEGIIIKPVNPLYYGNRRAVIFKKKNPKFGETRSKKTKPTENKNILEKNKPLLDSLLAKITKNRLLSVISKNGALTSDNIKKFKGSLIQDAVADYNKENEQSAKEQVSDPKQWKLIRQELEREADKVIQNHLKPE